MLNHNIKTDYFLGTLKYINDIYRVPRVRLFKTRYSATLAVSISNTKKLYGFFLYIGKYFNKNQLYSFIDEATLKNGVTDTQVTLPHLLYGLKDMTMYTDDQGYNYCLIPDHKDIIPHSSLIEVFEHNIPLELNLYFQAQDYNIFGVGVGDNYYTSRGIADPAHDRYNHFYFNNNKPNPFKQDAQGTWATYFGDILFRMENVYVSERMERVFKGYTRHPFLKFLGGMYDINLLKEACVDMMYEEAMKRHFAKERGLTTLLEMLSRGDTASDAMPKASSVQKMKLRNLYNMVNMYARSIENEDDPLVICDFDVKDEAMWDGSFYTKVQGSRQRNGSFYSARNKNITKHDDRSGMDNSPLSSVENSPLSSVENSPLSSVENSPLSSVENSPLSSVENSPLSSVENSPPDPIGIDPSEQGVS